MMEGEDDKGVKSLCVWFVAFVECCVENNKNGWCYFAGDKCSLQGGKTFRGYFSLL